MLIDVGPKSDRSDAGSRIIVPELRKLRVRQVDLVLISHPDSDHIGGLAAIAKRFRIGNVGAPASFKSHPEMLGALESAGIDPKKVLWIKEPTAIKWGNFRFHIDSMPWIPGASDNDGSMCVQVTDGRASATFSGDASEFAEEQLLPRWNWQGDILHVGHHGSASSSSFGWLREVHPKYAVISCGRMNPYGHPARAALDRLGQLKIPVLRTDLNGNITFKLGPNGFEPEINP